MRFMILALCLVCFGCQSAPQRVAIWTESQATEMQQSLVSQGSRLETIQGQLQRLSVAVQEIRGHTVNANPAEITPLTEDEFAKMQEQLGKSLEQPVQAAVFDDAPVTEDRVNELIEQFLSRNNINQTGLQTPVVQAPKSTAVQFVGAPQSECVNGYCYTPATRKKVLRFRRAR